MESKSKKVKSKSGAKEIENEDMENEEENVGESAMITAICWVGRGYAKPLLDEDDMIDESVGKHSKMIKKLAM